MANITAITRQYSKAVFIDHTRTYNSVPLTQKAGVKQYAGTSTTDPAQAAYYPKIYLEDINESLAAETVTQAQFDDILGTYPDIPNRPVIAAAEAPPA